MSLINVYTKWCDLSIFNMIWTENVPMTRINIFINFKHYNVIVIEWYGVHNLNFLLSPGQLRLSRTQVYHRSLTWWPPGNSTFLKFNGCFPANYYISLIHIITYIYNYLAFPFNDSQLIYAYFVFYCTSIIEYIYICVHIVNLPVHQLL